MSSSPLPVSIQIQYTAPDSPDIGQQRATLRADDPPLTILAVCRSELVLRPPSGQTLQVSLPTQPSKQGDGGLAVILPAQETKVTLYVAALPAGTAVVVKVKTKREHSKPERPLRAAFE